MGRVRGRRSLRVKVARMGIVARSILGGRSLLVYSSLLYLLWNSFSEDLISLEVVRALLTLLSL